MEQTKNNSIKWLLGAFAIIVLIILGFSTFHGTVKTGPVKIGVILPLSGDLAYLGESAKRGAELALENYAGTRNKYELIFEDDQFDAKKAVTAANKLISIDNVDAVVTFGSSGGNSVKPIAEKNKILHFAVATDPKVADGGYTFNHWTPAKEEVRALVAELLKRNIKKIGLLTVNQDGMLAIDNEITKQTQGTGISIVTDQKFNIGEKDFRTLIAKVKQNSPEILVMINYSPEIEILGRQIKDAGVKIPMTSVEGFDQTSDPGLFKGYWYASASDPSSEFANSFKTKYGKSPGFGTGNIYDIITLIITASENATSRGKPNTDDVISKLLQIKDLKGAMGSLSVGSDGVVLSKATIKTVK
jgi:branched-chain amino acid transport system substrate-binding protein